MITDPEAKGYRPPGCDRCAGGSSACCSFGCAADRELLELASEQRASTLHPAQVLDLAARCGVKGTGAALLEFAALVRDAAPLAPDEMRPAPAPAEDDAAPVPLSEQQVADLLFEGDVVTYREHRALINGDPIYARLGMLTNFANKVLAAAPGPKPQPGAPTVLKLPLTLRPAAPGNPATCEVLDAADRVLATGFTPLEGSEAILRVNIHTELVSALRQARDVLLGHDELRAVERVEGILAKAGAM